MTTPNSKSTAGLSAVIANSSSHPRQWCGPTALAAILGCTYMGAIWKISEVRGDQFISSSNIIELDAALRREGLKVSHVGVRGHTLLDMLSDLPEQMVGKKLLIRVTGHFVAFFDGMVCDSAYTRGIPTPFRQLRKGLGALVTDVLVVE